MAQSRSGARHAAWAGAGCSRRHRRRRRPRPTTPCASPPSRSSSTAPTSSPPPATTELHPGPVLRMREGKPVTVEVINDTDTPELVHWHGMLIPSEVDGTEEEGSPAGAAARPPSVSAHARPGRQPLVPLPRHGHGRPAQGRLYRPVRLCLRGWRQRPRPLRPGALPGAARLGAVLHRHHGRHGRRHPRRSAARKAADDEHRPRRPRGGLGDLLHQRQGAGVGRADPGARGPAAADSLPECQRDREPPRRAGRPQDEGDRHGRQPGAHAADARLGVCRARANASTWWWR